MDKIVVPTRFNKTGKRILKVPVTEKRICAPAYRIHNKACQAAERECRTERAAARDKYAESMAEWIASYVAQDSTPTEDKYRVVKFLAKQNLSKSGPMNITGPGSSARWSVQIDGIPGLSEVEKQAWETWVEKSRRAAADRDTALRKARGDCESMKRELWNEVTEAVIRQARADGSRKPRKP